MESMSFCPSCLVFLDFCGRNSVWDSRNSTTRLYPDWNHTALTNPHSLNTLTYSPRWIPDNSSPHEHLTYWEFSPSDNLPPHEHPRPLNTLAPRTPSHPEYLHPLSSLTPWVSSPLTKSSYLINFTFWAPSAQNTHTCWTPSSLTKSQRLCTFTLGKALTSALCKSSTFTYEIALPHEHFQTTYLQCSWWSPRSTGSHYTPGGAYLQCCYSK